MPALQSQVFWQPPTHTRAERHSRATSRHNFSRLPTTKRSNSNNPITISSDNDSDGELEEMNGDGDAHVNHGGLGASHDLSTSPSSLGTSRSALPATSMTAYCSDESTPTTDTRRPALHLRHSRYPSTGRSESEPTRTCYSTMTPTQELTPDRFRQYPHLATYHTQRRHSGDFAVAVSGFQQDGMDTNESDYPIDPLLEDTGQDLATSDKDAVVAGQNSHAASNFDAEEAQPSTPWAEYINPNTTSTPHRRFATLPSPTRSPSPGADGDWPRDSATFKEWLLDNTVLKQTVIDSKAVIQLQFEWPLHTKHCREVTVRHKEKQRRTSRSTARRDIRTRSRRVKFSYEEDELLRRLKDDSGDFSWSEIHTIFTATYPGRSRGALQVRYCTKLKSG